ncbi:40S ribosomal protein S27 [Podila epigama]|nr:40S ribosomal protein S27 [Podila epigama]
MTLAVDLLNPSAASEKSTHKLKRLVQSPDSFYMDVKCAAFIACPKCSTVLSQPTGGLARLSEGVSFRRKAN